MYESIVLLRRAYLWRMRLSDQDDLRIEPLTAELGTAFSDMLDQGGPASRCWCMAHARRSPERPIMRLALL
jgi:hypothetical protein